MIFYIIYNIILFFIIQKFNRIWRNLLNFILLLINISYYILKYRNYFYYSIFILFSSLICITYFIVYFNFNQKTTEKYLIYFLLLLSTTTFITVTLNKYYIYETSNNEAPSGNKGDQGKKGIDGEPAKILNPVDLCVNQMIETGNNEIKKYLEKKNKKINNDELLFKNLFMKRKYNQICSSNRYNNLKSRGGDYNAMKILQNSSKKWVKLILSYEQGFNFLNNYFYIDQKWNSLLSKNKSLNENINPFNIIKTDSTWNW